MRTSSALWRHALVGSGEPLLKAGKHGAVGRFVLSLHGLRQRFQRRNERGDAVGFEIVADFAVNFLRGMQEVRQRLRPAALAHQFVADEQVAADQGDVAVKA